MKKILNIIDTSGPGGAETVFINLCSAQRKAGLTPIAVIKGPGYVQDQLVHNEIKTIILPSKGSFNFSLLRNLVRIIYKENIDLIQSHLFGSAVYASLAGLICSKPVVSTIHGKVDINKEDRLAILKTLIVRYGCNRIISVSEQIRSFLNTVPFLPTTKIELIYNGVDASLYSRNNHPEIRKRLGLGNDLVIGSLGNIRTPKNYSLAIDTLKNLHESGVKAHYLIAGEGKGKLLSELKSAIHEAGLDKYVHLLGFVENVQDFLSSLDIFLISSSSEGHPLALTQAMINGIPIVSTTCGVEDILEHDQEAILTKENTAEYLSNGIQQLISTPSKAASLANAAKTKALSHYSLDAMTDKYLSLYESLY